MLAQFTRDCVECAANNRASSARARPLRARADQPVIVRICRSSWRLLRPLEKMCARDMAALGHSPCLLAGSHDAARFLHLAARQIGSLQFSLIFRWTSPVESLITSIAI